MFSLVILTTHEISCIHCSAAPKLERFCTVSLLLTKDAGFAFIEETLETKFLITCFFSSNVMLLHIRSFLSLLKAHFVSLTLLNLSLFLFFFIIECYCARFILLITALLLSVSYYIPTNVSSQICELSIII